FLVARYLDGVCGKGSGFPQAHDPSAALESFVYARRRSPRTFVRVSHPDAARRLAAATTASAGLIFLRSVLVQRLAVALAADGHRDDKKEQERPHHRGN